MKQVLLFFLLLTGTVVSQNYHYALEEKQPEATEPQAPLAPIELIASDITATTVTLSWTKAADSIGIASYNIYSNGALLAATTSGSPYVLTGLTAETTYNMTVRAVNAANNESPDSNVATFTTLAGGSNLANEDAYFDCYLLPIAQKNELQQALNTYGCVRLEAGDYGWSNAPITITSNQKLYGNTLISRTPTIIVAAGSTNVEIHNINTGYGNPIGITLEAGEPITNCKFQGIDFSRINATGAKIENCEFIANRNVQIIWDMSASGYFRNNKFIKQTCQNNQAFAYAQNDMKGNDITPSYGNVFVWTNYLTASYVGAKIDNVDDITFIGLDAESWNWADAVVPKGIANVNLTNIGRIRIQSFQGAAKDIVNDVPAYNLTGDKIFTNGMSVGSASNTTNIIEGNSINVSGGGSNNFTRTGVGIDLRSYFGNQTTSLNGTTVTSPITNQADIDSIKSILLPPQYTPWDRPTRVNLPNPTGSNWRAERVGKPDSHAYIQNLVDNNQNTYLQEGIYYISEPIRIGISKSLVGAGTGKTAIVALTDDFPVLKLTDNPNGLTTASGNFLSGLTIQGGSDGILFTSDVDPDAPTYPGYINYAGGVYRNIVLRDNKKGIRTYNIYSLDNNFFENIYFINNDIGIHQEPLYEASGKTSQWQTPFSNFIDKVVFYKCEFINNKLGMYFNTDRANNLNSFINCIFDGCTAISDMRNQNNTIMVNSDVKNSVSTQPLTLRTANFSYYACNFENNNVPYLFGQGATFADCNLLDEKPLFSSSGASILNATNSKILGTVPNKDGGVMLINTSIPNEPTYNKLFAVKGYMTPLTVVIDETPDPNPYPQLLVTH
ncbi:fibronectin type III domain-containing protein [Mariniflexile sp.]|uniref:fibronectin type III domain-containing protein n=1 Tax=Mariniflexile sp. TaxID=1979402 RepID=UPI003564638D